jgi:hypothetical protein
MAFADNADIKLRITTVITTISERNFWESSGNTCQNSLKYENFLYSKLVFMWPQVAHLFAGSGSCGTLNSTCSKVRRAILMFPLFLLHNRDPGSGIKVCRTRVLRPKI